MAIRCDLVNGPEFAESAARILQEAWPPPALLYSPACIRWQLSFPSAIGSVCAAAFDGAEPVGIAASTPRHFQCGEQELEAAVVSFVGVRPGWRGQGIAASLYHVLLRAVAEREVPVITYSVPKSSGERSLLNAYKEATFQIEPLGFYSNYASVVRPACENEDWRAFIPDTTDALISIARECSRRHSTVLWSTPPPSHMDHYRKDPRDRKLIVVENALTGEAGAAFGVVNEIATPQGIERILTLDSVWLGTADVQALRPIMALMAAAWSRTDIAPVIACPNLSGFDEAALRAMRIRKTGAGFSGYLCSFGINVPHCYRTNLEII